MNHDYEHCADFTDDCPKECFRAQLVRELLVNPLIVPNGVASWMHLEGTEECMRGEEDESED